MTHKEEYENFVGGYDPIDETGFCRRCSDFPCRCNGTNWAGDGIERKICMACGSTGCPACEPL